MSCCGRIRPITRVKSLALTPENATEQGATEISGKFVTKESFLSSNTDRVTGEMRRSRMDWCITHDDDASSGRMVRFATITALRNLSKSPVTARA